MSHIPVRPMPAVPGRNVIDGDVLYFKHKELGPLCGPVVCVGKDGVTIKHKTGKDGCHRVVWSDILGHKERRVRKLALLERGEDGAIAIDEDGKRVYIDGEIPDEEGDDELRKSNDLHNPKNGQFDSMYAPKRGKHERRGLTESRQELAVEKISEIAKSTADALLAIPPIIIPKVEGENDAQVREKCLEEALKIAKKLREKGLAIKNQNSGALIGIGTKKLRHAKSMSGDVRKALLLQELPSLLYYGIYFKSEKPDPRKAGDQNLVAYHKFAAPVSFGDGFCLAILHVEEDKNGGLYYDSAVKPEIERLDGTSAPSIASVGDRFHGLHRAYQQYIQNVLESKPGLGEIHTFFEKSLSPGAIEEYDAPLLIDIGKLHGEACDCALESLHKALSDEDGLAHNIWAEHENPFIRALVEKFSERGLTRLASVQSELNRWLSGEYHVPVNAVPLMPPGYLGRWSTEQLDLVRIYLQNIPPEAMTLDDWSMVIDYLVQRYLPFDALMEEAEWLAVKSGMMGKVQAHMGKPVDATLAAKVAEALPATVAEAGSMFNLPGLAESVLTYGKLRACDAVQAVSEGARHKLKQVVLDYHSQKLAGSPVMTGDLQSKLLDSFAAMNRDWRRIAVTEAGETANQGMIAALPPGSKVRRIEMYHGACAWCRKIDGRIFTVVAADAEKKDGDREVWPGKTNIGRSSSPRKRVGNELIERLPSERWWVAAGTQHPHCRGRWEPVQGEQPGDDPEFAAWLKKRMGQVEGV